MMSTRLGVVARAGLATLLIGAWACDTGTTVGPPPPPPPPQTPTNASDWVGFVNWDLATTVQVAMVENQDGTLSFSPANVTFEAGKPYILRISNAPTNGKHYWSPEGTSFYQAVATRKIQTADAEYKAPYFDAVEMLPGGTLEMYFVPVLAGTYDVICTITGHKAAGMFGTATITGGQGYQLDLEVSPAFDQALVTDSRRSGSHAVWGSKVTQIVDMFEAGDFSTLGYLPPDVQLSEDTGYVLTLENDGGHASKHYYTAAEFYQSVVMRKAQDSQAEIKAPYLKAVELLIGGRTELFIVPTQTGVFDVFCTIAGHRAIGMEGTITVQ